MKFSVPTNWQDDLIPEIRKDSVEELYGNTEAATVTRPFTVPSTQTLSSI